MSKINMELESGDNALVVVDTYLESVVKLEIYITSKEGERRMVDKPHLVSALGQLLHAIEAGWFLSNFE